MRLRSYQQDLIPAVRSQFAAGHRRVLLQMATGGGKTPVAAEIIRSAAERGNEVWMGCHKNFLLSQASQKLKQFGVPHGMLMSGMPYNQRQRVHVCSLGVLRNRHKSMRPPRLMVWDECHHLGAKTWAQLMEAFPDCYHLGLTATPIRPNGNGLGDYFDYMVLGPTVADLIEWGRQHPGEGLCGYRYFTTLSIGADGLSSRGGDFSADEDGALMDKPKIIGDAVAEMRRLAPGRRFLSFCPTIAMSEHTAEKYRNEGVNCVHLDGTMDRGHIHRVLREYDAGRIQGITSVNLFLEGLDSPGVGAVQWLRHTKSRVVKMQGDGRGMRNEVGKDGLIILDHVLNINNFGLPDADVEWDLHAKGRTQAPPAETRECVKCYARFPITQFKCPECSTEVVRNARPRAEMEQQDGELEEVTAEVMAKKVSPLMREQGKARSVEALTELAAKRGYANPEGYAKHIMQARIEKEAARVIVTEACRWLHLAGGDPPAKTSYWDLSARKLNLLSEHIYDRIHELALRENEGTSASRMA